MSPKIQLAARAPHAADVLVLPLTPEDLANGELLGDAKLDADLRAHLAELEFKADRGGVLVVPTLGRASEKQVVLVGLGKSEGAPLGTVVSEALAIGVRTALSLRPKKLTVRVGDFDGEAVALGVGLGAYKFDKYFHKTPREKATLELCTVVAPASLDKKDFARGLRIAEGVCLARDLVNEPPNELYPETFAARAREVAKRRGLAIHVLDPKGIQKAGMGLHSAVGQGSTRGPYFMHLTYSPAKPKGKIAFIGKGLTFDTGGICIKPMQGMADMKSDMAGGAAVLGLMDLISAVAPDVEVHGIIGAAENMPDGFAYRPADVIVGLNGKGVEIINTDAEGRLVLADALTYAARLAPDFMVDAATLTGATLISLGSPYSAYFTGVEPLAEAMKNAAQAAGESFWRMPLIEELAQQLKSDVTDLKHTGDRYGGAISAALFLREFTEGVPWMHCDVPGATYRERASGLHPKGGTGHAVLTFLELVRSHERKAIVEPSASSGGKKKPAAKAAPAKPAAARSAKKAPARRARA
ncbi:MAG TPA: leucyl aminopeptidase [Polyangiaceae bacterium]|nr:leucyl aminopeptidase [Polyangiaceae bacterium]